MRRWTGGAAAAAIAAAAVVAVGAAPVAVAVAAEEAPPALFALIVGVNKSVDTELVPLAYADDDAVRYHDLFRSLGARTYLLTRPDPNTLRVSPQGVAEAREPRRRELAQALAALAGDVARARKRGVRAVLYFIYAGHGNSSDNESAYLTLEDARLHGSDLARDVVDTVRADETHLIVDACYSYLLAFGRGPGGKRREIHGFTGFGELARRPNVGLLLSTSGARESHEWEAFQAGVFSHEVRSGLFGAADADGDGRVSYREIAAFVARANVAIPNERFRPEVFARPPRATAATPAIPILDLRRGLERRLTVDAEAAQAHYLLEDARGNRLADFHKASGHALSLLRPVSAGMLFLRRLSDDHEYEIPPAPDVVRLSELQATPARAAERGAAHHAFRLIFSLPFDEAAVNGYRLPAEGALLGGADVDATAVAPAPPPAPAPRSWRKLGGIGAVSLAAAAGVAGTIFAVASNSASDRAKNVSAQEDAERWNQRVESRNRNARICFGVGGAAAIAGAVLLLWPDRREGATRPVAHAGAGGGLLGVAGSF